MKIGTTLSVSAMLAAAMILGPGCKKSEDPAAAGGSAAPVTPPPEATGAAPTTDEVATYPNMTPQGGTVRLLQSFQVRQAADSNSKLLTGLSAGTLVDLKGSYSNWMMIMWPSGVGQLSPGWIELRSVNDNRVTQVVRDAGVPDVAVIPDAAPDVGVPVVDAGRVIPGDGGRPKLRVPHPPPRRATDADVDQGTSAGGRRRPIVLVTGATARSVAR